MSQTTTNPLEHYERVLAEAQGITAPVIIPLDLSHIDGLEVANTEGGERHECFELGPFDGNRYLRIRCVDNLVLADRLRRLADELLDTTCDERERRAEADKVECPGCRTRIAPDDLHCGTRRCARIWAQEVSR